MKENDLDLNYSPELDILSVDDTEKEYGRSIQSGDYIIDLGPDGEIRGVEIQNVSAILGVDREQLKNLADAELQMISRQDRVQVTVRLKIEEKQTTLAAQLTQPELSKA